MCEPIDTDVSFESNQVWTIIIYDINVLLLFMIIFAYPLLCAAGSLKMVI
jgi:hypothetical protein